MKTFVPFVPFVSFVVGSYARTVSCAVKTRDFSRSQNVNGMEHNDGLSSIIRH